MRPCTAREALIDQASKSFPKLTGLQNFVWIACAWDSLCAYPVKALRASFAALRPAVTGQSPRLEVVHAESDAFGQCWPQEFIVGLRAGQGRWCMCGESTAGKSPP